MNCPLPTQKLSDQVLLAWMGDHAQGIRTVAISTARGIIVVDTSLSRSFDAGIRRAIEKELARKDIKYLIKSSQRTYLGGVFKLLRFLPPSF